MTDEAKLQTDARETEAELLRALVQEQMAQIVELTRRLARAETQQGVEVDTQLLRASLEALERRLQDSSAIALGREASLASQILADGAARLVMLAEIDAANATMTEQRQSAERVHAEQRRRIAELESALQAAQEGTRSLQSVIDGIHASHSWKLTEPLRAGRRLLGGR